MSPVSRSSYSWMAVLLLALTVPNIPVVPLLAVLLPIMLFGPILYYPFSKTVWMAVDRAYLQRLDRNERFDERSR